MKAYRDADIDRTALNGARIAIIGYGNQGHAHALNLRDSGCDVIIGARSGSSRADAARAESFTVLPIGEAAGEADVIMLLAPDEHHQAIWNEHIAGRIQPGAALGFAHGLAVHFGLIAPPEDIDVILVAPKGPGHGLRSEYVAGRGLACLVAVEQDATGTARGRAFAYAGAIGGGRVAVLETSFKEECETDLFGEQAVLCGGIPDLIIAGFETLVEAGYDPELAYFECLHEVKLIVDLMVERGITGMREAISNTAEFGGYLTAPQIVTADTRAAMRAALADIRSGHFAEALVRETETNSDTIASRRRAAAAHAIEQAGARVRAMIRPTPESDPAADRAAA